MIKYFSETGVRNLNQNNTKIKIKFRGFHNLLLTKDFGKFKVLNTKKIRTVKKSHTKCSPQKFGKRNPFFKHKTPSTKTWFTSSKYQQNMI